MGVAPDKDGLILVSACLAGFPCRWNGEHRTDAAVVRLVRQGRAILICPEQSGGLPTPREAAEIAGGRVVTKSGRDVTAAFELGARVALEVARRYGCAQAILKSRSPSCGSDTVYDGTFSGTVVAGDGVSAALLKRNGIAVSTEEDLTGG